MTGFYVGKEPLLGKWQFSEVEDGGWCSRIAWCLCVVKTLLSLPHTLKLGLEPRRS